MSFLQGRFDFKLDIDHRIEVVSTLKRHRVDVACNQGIHIPLHLILYTLGFPYFRENPFSFSSKYFRFRPIFDENSTKITEYFRNFRGLENRKYRKFSIFSKFSSFEIAKIENNIFGIFNIFEIFEFRNFRNSKYRKWKNFLYFRNSSFQHITIFMVKNEYLQQLSSSSSENYDIEFDFGHTSYN